MQPNQQGGDARDRPTAAHQLLYRTWTEGGAAMLLTGNIMVDRRYLERFGNVAAEDAAIVAPMREWAAATHARGLVGTDQPPHHDPLTRRT